jgi:Ser/Thr protein kinase RdoA (MazF antagonist)
MNESHEIPLSGGAMLDRGIVKVGGTVRRPWGPWTPSVHAVLDHLAQAGFSEAPRVLGRDEQDREILSYLAGHDSGWPLRPEVLTDHAARLLGDLARRLQDALAAFTPPPDARWQFSGGPASSGQIIQHGDLGLWNILWHDGRPVGVIDWDFTHPAPPGFDIGCLAWSAIPCMDDERAAIKGFAAPPPRRARLEAFATGCRLAPAQVVDAVLNAQQTHAARIEALARQNIQPWSQLHAKGVTAGARRDHAWTTQALR